MTEYANERERTASDSMVFQPPDMTVAKRAKECRVCDVLSIGELYLIAGARSGVTVGPCMVSASERFRGGYARSLPASRLFTQSGMRAAKSGNVWVRQHT
jgi:hypothetical protein